MVYVHLAEGFEEVEALTVVDVLRRARINVEMVSLTGNLTVTGAHDINIEADVLYEEADYENCEMIVLPGGLPGAEHLQAHEGLKKHILCFNESGKKLAAICASPMVFAAHGILQGRNATIYSGMEEKLTRGGATPTGESTTVDGNVITGQGPALAMVFALEIVKELKGKKAADLVAKGLLYRG